ncbi:MAG: chaperone modulator CbpM [Acidobacteriota bacterium]
MEGTGTNAMVFWRRQHSLLTLEEPADTAGLHPAPLERLVRCGLIEPAPNTGSRPLFPASAEPRLRRILRVRRDLAVNVAGVAVILDMLERLEALQRELPRVRRP